MKYFQSILCVLIFSGTCIAQEGSDKVVTLNVSGEGKTKEEALQVALRSAIEQAFGTFISSNTQILNDELIKDEIVSVSNGNIQKYETLSEVQLPDGVYATTVRAIVSVSKLTTFCENKGVSVEFKGTVFAMNIKQKTLNEQNELKAIENMCLVLKDISSHSFDYLINAGEPLKNEKVQIDKDGNSKRTEMWSIPIGVNIKTNSNIKIMAEYLGATLRGLSLTNSDVENLTKLDVKVYIVAFGSFGKLQETKKKSKGDSKQLIYLRNEKSIEKIADLFFFFRESVLNFSINDGVNKIKGSALVDYDTKNYPNYYPEIKIYNFYPMFIAGENNSFYSTKNVLQSESNRWGNISSWRREEPKFSLREYEGSELQLRLKHNDGEWERTKSKYFLFLNEIGTVTPNTEMAKANALSSKYGADSANPSVKCIYDLIITFQNIAVGQPVATLSFKDMRTVEDLSKITGYTINPN